MKSTKETVRQRVDEIATVRLQGAEFADIRQYAAEKGWAVSDRQLRRYIELSDKRLAKTLEKNREKIVNRIIAQRRHLYARCMSVSDYGNCRLLLRDEQELFNQLWLHEEVEARMQAMEERVGLRKPAPEHPQIA